MSRPVERRWPLEPLIELTGWSMVHIRDLAPCGGAEWRNRHTEGVTERIADRLATAAGHHPYTIWPEMDAAAAEAIKATCQGCGEPYDQLDPRRRYCTETCRRTTAMRRWRSTEEGQANNRAACAKYRAENLDYERRRTRLASRKRRSTEAA